MQPPYRPSPSQPNQTQPLPPVGQLADKSTERALSALAHGAIAFGLFGIGFLVSLGIAGVIWLYARRSPEVRFHSEQAGCYQCSVLLINVIWIAVLGVSGGFSIFAWFRGEGGGLTGWVLIATCVFALWFFLSILYGLVAAIFVLMGKRFKYPIIGDRFEKRVW
ncbi:MAG: DUF4870 domain-containing protein [Chloroflexia bacterium]